MRRRTIIAALIGLVLDGASGIIFLINKQTLSLAFLLAMLILFVGLLASIVAFFFCLFLAARPSTRTAEHPLAHTHPAPATNARRGPTPLLWPLILLLALAIIWKLAPNLGTLTVNPTQFGALVAFILLIFPLIALLYAIFSRERAHH